MNNSIPAEVLSVSAQFGGGLGSTVLKPHFFGLKKGFRGAGDLIPCDSIRQVAFILRVDGDIVQFNFEGCERIDLNLRKKYISIDVGVPMACWKDRSDVEIAQYLASVLPDGLEQMLARLRAEKIACDEDQVRALFERGLSRYVSTWPDNLTEVG